MAPTPFRRRRKATTIARNLAMAEAALAMAQSRVEATGGAVKSGAGAAATPSRAAAASCWPAPRCSPRPARRAQARQGGPCCPRAPAPGPPGRPRAGPAVQLRRPRPGRQHGDPDPGGARSRRAPGHRRRGVLADGRADATRPAIDERAEEEAAAAEAAAIGGAAPEYAADTLDEPLDEADRAVAEGGGGVAEGQEQAEAELEENATVRDQAPSDAERQIDDVIEAQDEPWTGETPEPMAPTREPGDGDQGIVPGPGEEGGGISGRPGAGLDDAAGRSRTPGVPATGSAATEPHTGDEEGEPGRSGDSG